MNLDLISDSDWISVINGEREVQFEFLALQLFLANLRHRLQTQAICVEGCIRELKSFYAKFSRLPMAEKDFAKIANREKANSGQLLEVAEVGRKILAGQSLILAGAEELLVKLPPGKWIGGTIPYFMAEGGGCFCQDKIFVTEIPGEYQASTRVYAEAELGRIYEEAEAGGISFVILPADSRTHVEFALHAPRYADFALHPLVGWVAGIDLAMTGKATAKVFCGGPQVLSDAAVVMRVKLPDDCLAQVKIINLFKPGNGQAIKFPTTGLSATTAIVNGREQNFAEYLQQVQADLRLPLVANYYGAKVNVSIKSVDAQSGRIEFYAPVIAGIAYKLANPVQDYVSEFEACVNELPPGNMLFACNCILNYLHSKLEGRRISRFSGPVTFGEIAFQLLNQTLVYVEIVKIPASEGSATGPESNTTMVQLAAAHEELAACEQRFRMISESMPVGIVLTDGAGKLLYESPFCRKLRGAVSDQPGRSWAEDLHPDDQPRVLATLAESLRDGRDVNHEFRFVHPDGKICWVHSQTAFLRSDTGEITGRVGIVQDITGRREGEIELERVNRELVRASREAGIAEVATGVLHNVKNVINSINTSASIITEQVQNSKSSSLARAAALLREHASDLAMFLIHDPKGRMLPGYLEQLALQLAAERGALLEELRMFGQNVQHISDIVTMQQTYAKLGGTSEKIGPVVLMEDSLRFSSAALTRHGVEVVREYAPDLPEIIVEKHKVLQILVNFIRNAKHACQAAERRDRKLVLRVTNGGEFVSFVVKDNGIGIPPENLGRIFEHGFTTKKSGHGFGLHSGVLATRELGGELLVHSDGVGTGATFTLRLPVCWPAAGPSAS
jgi:PAS domain S-box-containing protein